MKQIDHNIIISWCAPIIPSNSIAGIPIGLAYEKLKTILSKYIVDEQNELYQFFNSPILKLEEFFIDDDGDGYYHFIVSDVSLTNCGNLFELQDSFYSRALHIGIRCHRVFFIKVWAFEVLNNDKSIYSYQGRTEENLGLYRQVNDFKEYSELEFDEAEEWFYTDTKYGGLEITGYGQSLEDISQQKVMAIAVIPGSAYMFDKT
ncbi:hypothetical protein [Acinetobacter soli]|uniref:hypothetical protein n=1 Tax=Acinetobacter soli TaxID=487316 RepID=UPI001D0B8E8E|nr:hypothetical protein [Acinetobacter soli]MCB8768615.1 hypothetical protein [Acinetobacter soli]